VRMTTQISVVIEAGSRLARGADHVEDQSISRSRSGLLPADIRFSSLRAMPPEMGQRQQVEGDAETPRPLLAF